MADYGSAYAWDEDGVCTGIAEYFPDHREHTALQAIEGMLEEWSGWFATSVSVGENSEFPWDEFHERGLALAKKLALLLKDNPPVCYQPPFEDPARQNVEEILIETSV